MLCGGVANSPAEGISGHAESAYLTEKVLSLSTFLLCHFNFYFGFNLIWGRSLFLAYAVGPDTSLVPSV
jgi:hypothetical protein